MEVVAARHGGPLPADEGGELARLIELIGDPDVAIPNGTDELMVRHHGRQLVCAERADDFPGPLDRRVAALAHHVAPALGGRIGHQGRIAFDQFGNAAERLRMIGHDEKIERPRKLRELARGGGDFLPARETKRAIRPDRAADCRRVE